MQLLVLGMHRSGTSMVTRLLNMAGAYFGPEGIATEANEENPKGFWERRDVRAICDALLLGADADWWRAADFDATAIPAEVLDEELPKLRRLILELDAHRPWVVKEPRLCLLLPVLRPLLEVPIAVHVTRDPIEVARSLARRNDFAVTVGTALWELYSVRSLVASAGMPGVHVDHAALMADPVGELHRLIDELEAHGVAGLRRPSEAEVRAFVAGDLHRARAERAEHVGWLTAHQAELADALSSGLAFADPTAYEVSSGALDTLRTFERQRLDALAVAEDLKAMGRTLAEESGRADRAEARIERELERFHAEQARAVAAEASAQRRQERGDQLRAEVDELRVELATRRAREADADAALARSQQHLERFLRTRTWRVPWKLTILKGKLTGRPVKVGPVRRGLDNIAVARRRLAPPVDGDPGAAGSGGATSTAAPAAPSPAAARASGAAAFDPASLPRPTPRTSTRPKVAVLAWDVGHNPLGRAWILAGMLRDHYEVEIWGAQFERYGTAVWAPLRDGSIPVHAFPGLPFPDHLAVMEEVASRIDADLLWAAKPRLPSVALGVLAKVARDRPLVIDDDDHELAFFGEETGLSLAEAAAEVRAGARHAELPFERTWTRATESVFRQADLITVSNAAIRDRVGGGMIVPHARDERLFDPARFDRRAVRAELGFDDDHRLLLFGGTPRAHKGALEVLEALERLGDDRYRVLMFGTTELRDLGPDVERLRRWIAPLPYTPFDELPRLVAAADLSCVLQDPTHPVVRYQLPAKITDALAMEVPCLVRDVPPLRSFVDAEVVAVLGEGELLHEKVAALFADRDELAKTAARGRDWFLREGSYAAVGAQVAERFDQLLAAGPTPLAPELRELVELPRSLFATSVRTSAPAHPVRVPRRQRADAARAATAGGPVDVVMFWKQNDSGIYGRRQDMVLEYLRRSGRVATIVHFDAPISPEQLVATYRKGRGETSDQSALVVRQTVERVLRRRDEHGVRRRTFVHAGSRTVRLKLPARSAYANYVRRTLEREGVGGGGRPVVFWTFPTNPDLPGLIDAFDPDVVVADVVDDNRTWYEPGEPGWDRTEANYREVLRRADVVLANCEPVAVAMRAFAPEVHVVPNGLELPSGAGRATGPRPAELADVRGPVLAYVGNLSDRIDVGLLEAIATARPGWTIVLVGSAHRDRSILALDRLANVRFLGVKPYPEVQRLLQHVDVGLIPHVDNEMTRAMNPLKAFVYASAGVPIVASPVANLAELGDLLTVADGPDGFLDAIEAALAAGRPAPDLAVLGPHAWDERIGRVLDLVDQTLGGRPDADRVDSP